MAKQEKENSSPKSTRREFFALGGLGMLDLAILGLTSACGGERSKAETVPFLFPDKDQLTIQEYKQQYDRVFYTGLKTSKYRDKEFAAGETTMEGLVWFRLSDGGHMGLQKGLTKQKGSPYETEEPKVYRSLEFQSVNSLARPDSPGQENTMVCNTLQIIDGQTIPPTLSTITTTWKFEGLEETSDESKNLNPQELFQIAKMLTERYNTAVSNNLFIE